MGPRHNDGSAGDANYGAIGGVYARYRRPEPRIAAFIHRALGEARTVLNVGAGPGSYEPADRTVTAVEPSAAMRVQRPSHLTPAIEAVAEDLPFTDRHFDASMATFTVHQWSDLGRGLLEMRRVTRGPVVILTSDPDDLDHFWLGGYAPGVIAAEARRYPPIPMIASALGSNVEVHSVPIPLDCADGFNEAYYGRPEMLLDPMARQACSAWTFVDRRETDGFVRALTDDLASGAWDAKFGYPRRQPEFDGSLRLVVGQP